MAKTKNEKLTSLLDEHGKKTTTRFFSELLSGGFDSVHRILFSSFSRFIEEVHEKDLMPEHRPGNVNDIPEFGDFVTLACEEISWDLVTNGRLSLNHQIRHFMYDSLGYSRIYEEN